METFSFNKLRFAVGLATFLWLASVTAQDNRELKTNRHEVAIETPLLLADFNAGRSVDFGALTVSQKAGVQVGGEQAIRWSDLVSVEVTDREVGIARRLGPPVVLPLRYVSMPQVCEAILRQGLRPAPAV